MFLVNLVPLLLLVGVLYDSGVDGGELLREQPSDLRESILSRFEKLVEYSHNHDTDAIMTMILPDSKVLMDGLPPVAGVEGIRHVVQLITERASRIENTFKEVQPMDEDANFVYVVFHFEFFNESDENYMSGNGLFIFKKTNDGYKFYISMFNKHNQLA